MIEVVSAGLSTTQFPIASAGAIFHASMSSGKFHGMTWPTTPSGATLRPGSDVFEFVGPAGVIEEMRGGHRHVEVARFLDRLAAVHRLGDGELARAILQQARDAVEVFGAFAAGHLSPDGVEGLLRRGVGGIDIGRAGECDFGELLLVGRD